MFVLGSLGFCCAVHVVYRLFVVRELGGAFSGLLSSFWFCGQYWVRFWVVEFGFFFLWRSIASQWSIP